MIQSIDSSQCIRAYSLLHDPYIIKSDCLVSKSLSSGLYIRPFRPVSFSSSRMNCNTTAHVSERTQDDTMGTMSQLSIPFAPFHSIPRMLPSAGFISREYRELGHGMYAGIDGDWPDAKKWP